MEFVCAWLDLQGLAESVALALCESLFVGFEQFPDMGPALAVSVLSLARRGVMPRGAVGRVLRVLHSLAAPSLADPAEMSTVVTLVQAVPFLVPLMTGAEVSAVLDRLKALAVCPADQNLMGIEGRTEARLAVARLAEAGLLQQRPDREGLLALAGPLFQAVSSGPSGGGSVATEEGGDSEVEMLLI